MLNSDKWLRRALLTNAVQDRFPSPDMEAARKKKGNSYFQIDKNKTLTYNDLDQND